MIPRDEAHHPPEAALSTLSDSVERLRALAEYADPESRPALDDWIDMAPKAAERWGDTFQTEAEAQVLRAREHERSAIAHKVSRAFDDPLNRLQQVARVKEGNLIRRLDQSHETPPQGPEDDIYPPPSPDREKYEYARRIVSRRLQEKVSNYLGERAAETRDSLYERFRLETKYPALTPDVSEAVRQMAELRFRKELAESVKALEDAVVMPTAEDKQDYPNENWTTEVDRDKAIETSLDDLEALLHEPPRMPKQIKRKIMEMLNNAGLLSMTDVGQSEIIKEEVQKATEHLRGWLTSPDEFIDWAFNMMGQRYLLTQGRHRQTQTTESREMADAREILGVGEQATPDEIKRAYRKLARAYHPDARGPDDTGNDERIKEINLAYNLLTD